MIILMKKKCKNMIKICIIFIRVLKKLAIFNLNDNYYKIINNFCSLLLKYQLKSLLK